MQSAAKAAAAMEKEAMRVVRTIEALSVQSTSRRRRAPRSESHLCPVGGADAVLMLQRSVDKLAEGARRTDDESSVSPE